MRLKCNLANTGKQDMVSFIAPDPFANIRFDNIKSGKKFREKYPNGRKADAQASNTEITIEHQKNAIIEPIVYVLYYFVLVFWVLIMFVPLINCGYNFSIDYKVALTPIILNIAYSIKRVMQRSYAIQKVVDYKGTCLFSYVAIIICFRYLKKSNNKVVFYLGLALLSIALTFGTIFLMFISTISYISYNSETNHKGVFAGVYYLSLVCLSLSVFYNIINIKDNNINDNINDIKDNEMFKTVELYMLAGITIFILLVYWIIDYCIKRYYPT